ncbi:ABC transporter substrate-binding protein [Gorillibacterium timonense]|uniref:ABC transporter substrate-binding protein n=1 Tax=Gorillibacterium timonense TaxID=1689269 RepID=UPI00071CACA3|nr:extracellular solute-binding protein [Gorillibacterium timonense]
MKKKLSLLLVSVMALSSLAAGCGSKDAAESASPSSSQAPAATESASPSPEPTKAAEPFKVSLRHIQIGDAQKNRKKILDDVVAKTEAEIPGLKFELDGVEDNTNRFTKLPAEMAAGNPPKIMDLFGGEGDALKYGKAGRLLDLAPVLEEIGIKQDQFVNLNQFKDGDKLYGLPLGGSSEGFYYNKDLFAKFNIAEPQTLEDLEKAAETLKANKITPFAMGSKGAWVPLMLVNTLMGRYAGPEIVKELADGSKKWTDPTVVAAFTKYKEWVDKGYFTKGELGLEYGQMLDQFVTGKAGMMFDGSWRSSVFKDKELSKDLFEKAGYFALPAVPNGVGDQKAINANYSNGYGFSADLNENELAAVKAFIKNLYNEEMQLRGLLEDGVLPSMKLSADAKAKVTDPIVTTVMSQFDATTNAFSHFDSTVKTEVYQEAEKQIGKLIAGQTTPEKMGAAVQAIADKAAAK